MKNHINVYKGVSKENRLCENYPELLKFWDKEKNKDIDF